MADWRQIQARIRKAKTSSDPSAQLAELYQRTSDAMVAFELAQWHEKAGDLAAAAQWYTTAAQRFRRAQWRTKAEEALTRLGAPIPAPADGSAQTDSNGSRSGQTPVGAEETEQTVIEVTVASEAEPERESLSETSAGTAEEQPASLSAPGLSSAGEQQKRKRRRGRRGGRGRRKGGRVAAEAVGAVAAHPTQGSPRQTIPSEEQAVPPVVQRPVREYAEPEEAARPAAERSQPAVGAWQSRTRAGEPALASRISQLESQLRRLLACPQASLDEADQAPAGPGVLVLSDSDQVTHYYIEACQTLRIAIGNLVRGGRGDTVRLKDRLAEHLGIPESRAAKYLKEHCCVRWVQLDEGAKELAHFAIAVLRPAVNE